MKVVRSLERRLERLLEGVVGRVFSGRLHPSEIAGRLAREADFARFKHETGPATANSFSILVNPRDLTTVDVRHLEDQLTEEVEAYAIEEGLRMEGPIGVSIQPSDEVAPGAVMCHVEVVPGPSVPWARLVSTDQTFDIGRNRSLVGRAEEADVRLPHDDVSRRHALLWRQGGQVWVQDLGSANGTTVDGNPIRGTPVVVQFGSVLQFSEHSYRLIGL